MSMIDLFTDREVQAARVILKSSHDSVQAHRRILNEIVTDEVMARIDADTGQPNSRDYMAYRLGYIAQ